VSEGDPTFRPFINNPQSVKDWVRDSNAVAQEKALDAACALIEWGGKAAAK
jgi:cytoskeleton-associated protein 5